MFLLFYLFSKVKELVSHHSTHLTTHTTRLISQVTQLILHKSSLTTRLTQLNLLKSCFRVPFGGAAFVFSHWSSPKFFHTTYLTTHTTHPIQLHSSHKLQNSSHTTPLISQLTEVLSHHCAHLTTVTTPLISEVTQLISALRGERWWGWCACVCIGTWTLSSHPTPPHPTPPTPPTPPTHPPKGNWSWQSCACLCSTGRKMMRLLCLCVHRNMNVIIPPHPTPPHPPHPPTHPTPVEHERERFILLEMAGSQKQCARMSALCARMTRFRCAQMTRLQCAQMTRFQCAQMSRWPDD